MLFIFTSYFIHSRVFFTIKPFISGKDKTFFAGFIKYFQPIICVLFMVFLAYQLKEKNALYFNSILYSFESIFHNKTFYKREGKSLFLQVLLNIFQPIICVLFMVLLLYIFFLNVFCWEKLLFFIYFEIPITFIHTFLQMWTQVLHY